MSVLAIFRRLTAFSRSTRLAMSDRVNIHLNQGILWDDEIIAVCTSWAV